jgi:bifunctional non-homologous end joining protein LigD
MTQPKSELEVGGRHLEVSNLNKVMYPRSGFTKADVINYYISVADVLLPHLKDRPLTLKRYPDGVEAPFFYEKQCPVHRPPWIRTQRVESRNEQGEVNYCVPSDVASLVWVANLASLELHTFLHRARALTRPTSVAFDLDPGPPADIIDCCRVALGLRKSLEDLGLEAWPKTSGSKGLQVYVPLNSPVSYEKTKEFARTMARYLEATDPALIVTRMEKARRRGKVFIDWSQNDPHKTTICVYSLRAKPDPTVSTPVTWEEIDSTVRRENPLSFTTEQVLKRVAVHGDLFAPVLTLRQKLPPASEVEALGTTVEATPA